MKKYQSKIALLSCLVLLLGFVFGLGNGSVVLAAEEPTKVIYGADTEMTSISPFEKGVQGCQTYQIAVYEYLLTPMEDGTFAPALAESCEWQDDNTILIQLREGVKFHDGSDFTTEDVMASIATIAKGTREAPRYAMILQDECYSEGDYTLYIKTTGYNAPLISNLARVPMCDKDWLDSNDSYDQISNGTGPYMLDAWNMGVDLVLVRNPEYWDAENVPYYDIVDIRFFNDGTTAFLEFEAGNLDVVYVQSAEDIDTMLNFGMDGAYIVSTSLGAVTMLNMSQMVEDTPFTDINLRKAIAHAIDWETLISAICGNGAILANSVIASSDANHVDQEIYAYDPDLARECLEQYKADHGIDGDFELATVVSAKDYNVALCEAMQAYLAEIGITLKIDSMQHSEFNALAASGGITLTINQMPNGADSHAGFMAMERGSGNMTAEITDDTICDLIAKATETKDPAERSEMYAEIQQLMHDGYWAIPMFEGLHYFAARDGIQGLFFQGPDFQLRVQNLYAE